VSLSATEVPVTPGELAANPDKYDGKHVTVRGFVVIGSHERNIFDSKRGYEQAGATCLGLLGTKSFVSHFRKRVETVKGTFHKALCGPNDICLLWCSAEGIEVDEQ
jgi:hypothetical protein